MIISLVFRESAKDFLIYIY